VASPNFYLGRHFVFHASPQSTPVQGARYLLLWLGSMGLNAAGVYLFTQVLHLNYLHSKVVVSLLVGIRFNYLLQRYFVFKKS
jgi:putative flippase GtrA